jgi:hypothetical protein
LMWLVRKYCYHCRHHHHHHYHHHHHHHHRCCCCCYYYYYGGVTVLVLGLAGQKVSCSACYLQCWCSNFKQQRRQNIPNILYIDLTVKVGDFFCVSAVKVCVIYWDCKWLTLQCVTFLYLTSNIIVLIGTAIFLLSLPVFEPRAVQPRSLVPIRTE